MYKYIEWINTSSHQRSQYRQVKCRKKHAEDFGNSGQVQLGESPKSDIEGMDNEGTLYFVMSYNAIVQQVESRINLAGQGNKWCFSHKMYKRQNV